VWEMVINELDRGEIDRQPEKDRYLWRQIDCERQIDSHRKKDT
jgi:hypothetical protein